MSARFIAHTIYLATATILTYLWTNNPTTSLYTLQLIAILIITYFAIHLFSSRITKSSPSSPPTITIDIIILTITILLIVTQTGGLSSPFFFTIYFLLFAVALLFEIEATLVLTGTFLIFFTLLPSTDLFDTLHVTHLVSMLMITPLAIFTAHQYEEKIIAERKSAISDFNLTEEETDVLMFLSLNLKNTLISSLDKLNLIIPRLKLSDAKQDLTVLYQDLKELYRSADELQRSVDQQTDQ